MSNCVRCQQRCDRTAEFCNRCQSANNKNMLLALLFVIVLVFGIGGIWISNTPVEDPYTFSLNSKQAAMVLDCWGNGWDTKFQSDGVGGVDVTCKAAH